MENDEDQASPQRTQCHVSGGCSKGPRSLKAEQLTHAAARGCAGTSFRSPRQAEFCTRTPAESNVAVKTTALPGVVTVRKQQYERVLIWEHELTAPNQAARGLISSESAWLQQPHPVSHGLQPHTSISSSSKLLQYNRGNDHGVLACRVQIWAEDVQARGSMTDVCMCNRLGSHVLSPGSSGIQQGPEANLAWPTS